MIAFAQRPAHFLLNIGLCSHLDTPMSLWSLEVYAGGCIPTMVGYKLRW